MIRHAWQPYTAHQLISFALLVRALDLVYDLDRAAIQHHGAVASSRVDAGPHLPLTYLLDLALSSDDILTKPWLQAYRTDADWMEAHPQAR